jgi:hypothetical protein
MTRPPARLTRRGQAVADLLVTLWFLVTMGIILAAWFGLIP